jgi:hypothetical protein
MLLALASARAVLDAQLDAANGKTVFDILRNRGGNTKLIQQLRAQTFVVFLSSCQSKRQSVPACLPPWNHVALRLHLHARMCTCACVCACESQQVRQDVLVRELTCLVVSADVEAEPSATAPDQQQHHTSPGRQHAPPTGSDTRT